MNLYDEFSSNNIEYDTNPLPHKIVELANNFNIIYINIIKLISEKRRNIFSLFLSNYGIVFDAIVLCETGFTSSTDAYNIEHYDSYHNCRVRSGGGVSVYILDKHKSTESLNCTYQENQTIIAHLPNLHFNLGALYRQQRSCPKLFCEWLDGILSTHKNTILCGDMNLNLATTDDPKVQLYIDTILSNNFLYLNSKKPIHFTRSCNSTKTFIDHCIVDKFDLNYKFFLFDHSISDHRHFVISFNNDSADNTGLPISGYKTNYQSVYKLALKALNAPIINFNEFRVSLNQLIIDNTTIHAHIGKKINLSKPWFTKKHLEIKKLRDRYYKL